MAEEGNRQRKRTGRVSPEEEEQKRLLQKALGYVLKGAEAEETAESLFAAFGSLSAVFSAPQAELERTPGVRREAAEYLRLTLDLARVSMEDRAAGLKRIFDTASAVEAFLPKFLGRTTEAVGLILLDGRGRPIYNRILSEGSVSEVPIYIRRLVQLCIEYDSADVILAHNHPSGTAAPSRNDITVTRRVEMALESIDATLRDHIILAGEDYYSFQDSGMLLVPRQEVRDYRRRVLEQARQQERELLDET